MVGGIKTLSMGESCNSMHILLAEDDPISSKLMLGMLGKMGIYAGDGWIKDNQNH